MLTVLEVLNTFRLGPKETSPLACVLVTVPGYSGTELSVIMPYKNGMDLLDPIKNVHLISLA